jgi:branched-chain amino acid transport system ATP-binding protein
MNTSDRITVMQHGKIIAEGAPAEIAASPIVQQAYLGGGALGE